MAKLFLYDDHDEEAAVVDLLNYKWRVITEEKWIDDDIIEYRDLLNNCRVPLRVDVSNIQDIFPDVYTDPVWYRVELGFTYDRENDPLWMFPLATRIECIAEYPYSCAGWHPLKVNSIAYLSDEERGFFTTLLQEAIGDKHTPEMQRVMIDYHNAVDKEIYNFVQGILHDMELPPVTVAYFSTSQCDKVKAVLPDGFQFAPRVTMDADAVRHIIRRHGRNGKADESMADESDIARIAYVLTNFDNVKFEGNFSYKYKNSDGTKAPHVTFKKRIDGTYYVVEALCDNKRMLSHIVTAYQR